jgi:hypothetical protein
VYWLSSNRLITSLPEMTCLEQLVLESLNECGNVLPMLALLLIKILAKACGCQQMFLQVVISCTWESCASDGNTRSTATHYFYQRDWPHSEEEVASMGCFKFWPHHQLGDLCIIVQCSKDLKHKDNKQQHQIYI